MSVKVNVGRKEMANDDATRRQNIAKNVVQNMDKLLRVARHINDNLLANEKENIDKLVWAIEDEVERINMLYKK